MSRRIFWRWLLLGADEWPWMSRRPLWQYLLLDWAIWVLAGLAAFAIATGILGHFGRAIHSAVALAVCLPSVTLSRCEELRR